MNKQSWKYVFLFLILSFFSGLVALFQVPKKDTLSIIACDVGQGDAILIIFEETQILVDGGPNSDVMACLEKNIAYWDRSIEVVILTHPQSDHLNGLLDVFEAYDVEYFIHSGLDTSNQKWQVLKSMVGRGGTKVLLADESKTVRLGPIQLDILHPNSDFFASKGQVLGESTLERYSSKADPNDFSVVAVVRLGEFEALLTGDISPSISAEVAEILLDRSIGGIEYIKIPHHGSKNGLSEKLLEVVEPKIAVISVGRKNRYGHPHKEVLEMLESFNIKILRTDEQGSVVIESDGESFWVKGN